MKIYLFYFRDKNDKRNLEPILYAYTNDEELAEGFRNFRDMKKFLETERDLSKDQYKDFQRTYPSNQLTLSELDTKDPDNIDKKIKIPMILTWQEEKSVLLKGEETYSTFFQKCIFNPYMFDLKIQKSLYQLGFFSIYQWLYSNMYIYEPLNQDLYSGVFSEKLSRGYEDDSYNELQIELDSFGLFLYFFFSRN
jgi:hypothetical protein